MMARPTRRSRETAGRSRTPPGICPWNRSGGPSESFSCRTGRVLSLERHWRHLEPAVAGGANITVSSRAGPLCFHLNGLIFGTVTKLPTPTRNTRVRRGCCGFESRCDAGKARPGLGLIWNVATEEMSGRVIGIAAAGIAGAGLLAYSFSGDIPDFVGSGDVLGADPGEFHIPFFGYLQVRLQPPSLH